MNSFRDRLRNSITAEETEVSTTVEIPEAPPKTNQEYEIVSVNDISPHPQNARKGNINAIRCGHVKCFLIRFCQMFMLRKFRFFLPPSQETGEVRSIAMARWTLFGQMFLVKRLRPTQR